MQDQPARGHICLALDLQQLGRVVEQILVVEHTFLEMMGDLVDQRLHMRHHFLLHGFDVLDHQGVHERGLGGIVRQPHHGEINGESEIVRDDPVVVEMLVDNLAHDCGLVVENVGAKVENHIEHAGLGCERGRAMGRVRVGADLLIDVVGAQAADDHLWHVLGEREAAKVVLGVVGRALRGGCGAVSRASAELADLVDVWDVALALVADVGDEHALSDDAFDALVEKEQHHTKEKDGLCKQLLSVGVEQHAFECVLNKHAFLEVGQIPVEVLHVAEDRVEQLEEPLQNANVVLSELFVEIAQLGRRKHVCLGLLRIAKIRKVKQDSGVLCSVC
eukprot:comp24754_c0_seq1/m.60736 comp24754_c0_seq1/g.60736  ORF comp24754_c0_seq1/g.60736 comp24754_c0_seq1/m.60736 type:complete len:333 (-) comp24754_c0_seq1:175-1173(-)